MRPTSSSTRASGLRPMPQTSCGRPPRPTSRSRSSATTHIQQGHSRGPRQSAVFQDACSHLDRKTGRGRNTGPLNASKRGVPRNRQTQDRDGTLGQHRERPARTQSPGPFTATTDPSPFRSRGPGDPERGSDPGVHLRCRARRVRVIRPPRGPPRIESRDVARPADQLFRIPTGTSEATRAVGDNRMRSVPYSGHLTWLDLCGRDSPFHQPAIATEAAAATPSTPSDRRSPARPKLRRFP